MHKNLITAGLFAFCAITPSHAATIDGVDFTDQAQVGEQTLNIVGTSLLRYKIVFKGYVGAFYLPKGSQAKAAFADVPRRLDLHYYWDIPAEKFGPAANEILADNISEQEIAALRSKIDDFHSAYVDIAEGERYTLSYQPGVGTTLAHNGKPLKTVAGLDFANAYFSIWLGKNPIDDDFRDELLGLDQ